MNAIIEIDNKKYNIDFDQGIDISIPLYFNGNQPNTYSVEKAISRPYTDDNFIGDTRKGGPCNFETYTLTPHCNGTHTECIGHITDERISLLSSLKEEMIPCSLISVFPKNTNENYTPKINPEDLVITRQELEGQLGGVNSAFLKAVVVRTLPNDQGKKNRDYMKESSAFFSLEAMEYIVSLGVQHILVDTPSVDRLFDDGCLTAHNVFWKTKGKKLNIESQNKTITEMVFAGKEVKDGKYLLNLQIPAFVSDAAPSRPILYPIHEF